MLEFNYRGYIICILNYSEEYEIKIFNKNKVCLTDFRCKFNDIQSTLDKTIDII